MTIPFTYKIGWSKENTYYYGVRFGEGCSPNDLWSNYFTSSKKVKYTRELYGEPDVIEIRKTFVSGESARDWETKVIKKMNMVESDNWLNQTDNTGNFYWQGRRGPFSKDHKKKLSDARSGRKLTKEHAEKLHAGRRGQKMSEEHKLKLIECTKNRVVTSETKKKMIILSMNNIL